MAASVGDAVRALARGGLVVFPTDTLYGLAADARDPRALARLLEAKGRPERLAVSVAVSSHEELEGLAALDPPARAFVRTRLPGPWTALARPSRGALRSLPTPIARATGRIGLRIPDHPVARELARLAGPVTCTSANLHGAPAARTLAEARRALGARVAVYLDGPPRPSGVASAIVDLTARRPTLRRRP